MSKENFEQKKLTTELPTDRLEWKGDIFMADGPSNPEGPPAPKLPRKPRAPRVPPSGAPQPDQAATNPPTPEALTAAWRQFREELTEEGWPADLLGPMERVAAEAVERGEMPPKREASEQPQPAGREPLGAEVSPAEIAAAKRAWAAHNRGRDISPDDRRRQDFLISQGIAPVGAEPRGSSVRLYIEPEDLARLEQNPLAWLDSKLDILYQVVKGQELASPQISQLQQQFSVGANYLSLYAGEPGMPSPRAVEGFITAFNARLNLIVSRSAIEHRDIKSARQSVERLQSHGLLTVLGMENGQVSVMFARMEEMLEHKRLTMPKGHVTPEMISRLQRDLVHEQLSLAIKGVGDYSEVYEDARAGRIEGVKPEDAGAYAERQITRAVRAAYDAFVVCQREAVIVARGHHLEKLPDTFQSDPGSLFNMFNLEDLLTEKFRLFNKQAHAFLDEIKLEMARSKLPDRGKGYTNEQLINYGTRMFRDLFAVPDFLSSGWKIDYITDKITENVAQKTGLSGEDLDERTKDLALFLRLTRNLSDANDFSTRPEIWRRIAEIRPEEMVRLYRERTMDENGAVNPALERQLGNFFSGSAFDGFRVYKTGGNQTTEIDGIATYDKFKQEFGAIIQLVRQNAYNTDFRAIRIGETGERGLSDADKAIIAKYFGGGAAGLARVEQLQRMYAHFTEVATAGTVEIYKEGEILPGGRVIKKGDIHIGKAKSGSGVIHDLLDFDTFEDIYTRTLLVDDALLGILDRPSETILPLSETWTPGGEVAQDPLVRNFGDLEHAANAAAKLIGFVYTEDMKARLEAAMEFAEEASQYGGQTTRSECIRYTVGTLLEMQKIPIAWDALGVGKLPFRQVMTIIERIYGPHAQTMSRGDLRKELDSRRSVLSPEAYRELEHILEVTPEDTLKLRGLSLVFFLIFAAFDLGVAAIDVNSLTPGGKK